MEEKEAVMSVDNGVNRDFAVFYKENLEMLYHYIYRVFPNKQIAEDIMQETFYVAFKKQSELWEHPNPRYRLLRIARYKMKEFRKKMRYRNTEPWEPERFDLAEEDVSYDIKELDVAACHMLGEKEWRLLKKYYMFGVTISELAKAEGITENNMRVRLSRWMKTLRNQIEG